MWLVEGACGAEFDEFEAADGCSGHEGCLTCQTCDLLVEDGYYGQEQSFDVDPVFPHVQAGAW